MNSLSVNQAKWSNTLKQFVGNLIFGSWDIQIFKMLYVQRFKI